MESAESPDGLVTEGMDEMMKGDEWKSGGGVEATNG